MKPFLTSLRGAIATKQSRWAFFLAMGLIFYPLAVRASGILQQDLRRQGDASAWPNLKEWGTYQARLAQSQELLWEVSWEMTVRKGAREIQVEVYEQGHGTPWGDDEPIIWEKQMHLQVLPEIKVQSLEGNRWTTQGVLASSLTLQVDPRRGKVVYKDTKEKGAKGRGEFPWVPNLIPKEFLFHWIRTLAFDQVPTGECLLLVSPTRRFRMTAQLSAREEVTTPAGTFSCYRVDLLPDIGPLRLLPIKSLVPKMTLWCKADLPHLWVRYTGPVGSPGSPAAVIELTSWKAG